MVAETVPSREISEKAICQSNIQEVSVSLPNGLAGCLSACCHFILFSFHFVFVDRSDCFFLFLFARMRTVQGGGVLCLGAIRAVVVEQ